MKASIFFLLLLSAFLLQAQPTNCVFQKPAITIHFGSGNSPDVNTASFFNYERVGSPCPRDGYYTYTPYTSDCFSGDWFDLSQDHTPGDASGNMLVVNSSYTTGTFLETTVKGLKPGKIYEFGAWLMNVCRITDKCPFPLLPNLIIRLQTPSGKTVAQFGTGEVQRTTVPHWTQHRAYFTMPAAETSLTLVMMNTIPGGCGNDFALDDITFRECVIQPPPVTATPKKTVVAQKKQPATKPVSKPKTPVPVKDDTRNVEIVKPQKDSQVFAQPTVKPKPRAFPKPPAVLTTRTNDVVKQIEADPGKVIINLYDNGEIDGDTISIYHNNVLVMSRARLSQKPITIPVTVDTTQPHHEFVMVAENLGSIPPNTSVMIITAGDKRYEVFISSNEQRNAKLIIKLKE